MTEAFTCPSCDAPLKYSKRDDLVVYCDYCKTPVILPAEMRGQQLVMAENLPGFNNLTEQTLQLKKIVELTRSNQKIEAIKLYREVFPVDLHEAKDAVEQIEAGQGITVISGGVAIEDKSSYQQDGLQMVAQLLREKQKINAVKLYRQLFDVGLKEAKDAVEQIELDEGLAGRGDIQLKPEFGAAEKQKPSCAKLVVPLLAVLIPLVCIIVVLVANPDSPLYSLWNKYGLSAPAVVNLTFGEEGIGTGSFEDARYVGVDGEENIYVGEYSNGRIQVFDADGEFISMWRIGDDILLMDMAVDRDGVVYLVYDGGIYRYDGLTGELIDQLVYEEGDDFEDVTIGSDGEIVAAWMLFTDNVVRFNKQGEVTQVIEAVVSGQTGDSELDIKLAVDGLGNVYALGTFNNAVFKYSPEGKYINRFGGRGDEPGLFRAPDCIAVDNQGRVYVGDLTTIEIFDSDGRYLEQIEVDGAVFDLAFDDQHDLIVVTGNQKVLRYTITLDATE